MKHIRRDSFLDHEFPLPPELEQRRIADRLDAIQSRTQKTGETLDQVPDRIDEYRQSVLNAAFTGQLTADWRADHPDVEPTEQLLKRAEDRRTNKYKKRGKLTPIEEDSVHDIPESWMWAQVGDVASHIRYGTSDKAKYEYSGIPMIRMGDIENGRIHFDDLKYMPEDWEDKEKFLCAKLHQDIYAPDLLASYINSAHGRRYINAEIKQQVGQANVNATKMASMPIPVPPAEEQEELLRRVRQRLDKIDEMAQHVAQARGHLDHLDRSVLAKAFRGDLVETEAERARREDRDYETAEELLERVQELSSPAENANTESGDFKSTDEESVPVNENGQFEMKVVKDDDIDI